MGMIGKLWTNRILVALDAVILGAVIDRLSATPLWGPAFALSAALIGLVFVNRLGSTGIGFLRLDRNSVGVIITAGLTLLFFIECLLMAYLVLNVER